jgi:hypothetical protein
MDGIGSGEAQFVGLASVAPGQRRHCCPSAAMTANDGDGDGDGQTPMRNDED